MNVIGFRCRGVLPITPCFGVLDDVSLDLYFRDALGHSSQSPVKFKYFWTCLFTNHHFFGTGLCLKKRPCFCKTGLSLRLNMKCFLLTFSLHCWCFTCFFLLGIMSLPFKKIPTTLQSNIFRWNLRADFSEQKLCSHLWHVLRKNHQPLTPTTIWLPSWELTYPVPKLLLKMIFLFPRWDMLVPWSVISIGFQQNEVDSHLKIPSLLASRFLVSNVLGWKLKCRGLRSFKWHEMRDARLPPYLEDHPMIASSW